MSTKHLAILAKVVIIIAGLIYLGIRETSDTADKVAQFEQDVRMYTAQVDSLNRVVISLEDRINDVRAQLDSARSSNQTVVAALQRVTGELKEYRRIAEKQKERNGQLVAELGKVKEERDRSIEHAREMKTQVDSLNVTLYEQSLRLVRLEARMREQMEEHRAATEALSGVLVHTGTVDELVEAGYLKVKDTSIFTKNYYLVGFPGQVVGPGSPVEQVAINAAFPLPGELEVVADRHGKLKEGREYTREQSDGHDIVTFTDSTLFGQRLLVVLK